MTSTLHTELTVTGTEWALQSVSALRALCEDAPELLPDALGEVDLGGLIDVPPDFSDLFVVEPFTVTTNTADQIGLRCVPTKLYLDIVAAVQGKAGARCVFNHGWPVLSLGSVDPSVAEAGDGVNLPGGGL